MEVNSSLDLTTHVVDHGAHFERSVVYVLCKSYLHSFHKKETINKRHGSINISSSE